jgi:hypothetical protein
MEHGVRSVRIRDAPPVSLVGRCPTWIRKRADNKKPQPRSPVETCPPERSHKILRLLLGRHRLPVTGGLRTEVRRPVGSQYSNRRHRVSSALHDAAQILHVPKRVHPLRLPRARIAVGQLGVLGDIVGTHASSRLESDGTYAKHVEASLCAS